MLTEAEKHYVTEFLNGLPLHSVLSVAHTVSKGMLKPEDKIGAIKVIIQHSESAETILNRKLISKQYLFHYLHWRDVSVSQSCNKNDLVQEVISLWEKPYKSKEPMPQTFQDDSDQNGSASYPPSTQTNQAGCETYSTLGRMNTSNPSHQNPATFSDSQSNYSDNSYNSYNSYNSDVAVSNRLSNSSSAGDRNLVFSNPNLVSNAVSQNNFNVDELALRFAEWFYGLVNKSETISSNSSDAEWGPQHFWQDASIKINLISDSEVSSHEATGSGDVSELLLNIKIQHSLFFNPNLSQNGVRGKSEPHGMAVIVACGTLHAGVGQFIGVFEQIFYLLRDPMCSNNWKIKQSQLILRSRSMNALEPPPTLNNSELAHSLQLPALT